MWILVCLEPCSFDKAKYSNDYIRSIFFDATGSLKFSALFNNTNDLLNHMKLLDNPIDSASEMSCSDRRKSQPLTNHDVSNNPVRDFLYGILNSTNYKLYSINYWMIYHLK